MENVFWGQWERVLEGRLVVLVQIRDIGGMDQGSSIENGEEQQILGCVWQIELIGLIVGFNNNE